ncbi:FAD-dependent oxidoreductase [Embleya sp. NPDC020630]|uniref:FAD-dependent oxidoreductase n=1 Tax=Embleya sp. NPDC020630 TaxID=3363979 RepID=UPI0037BA4370
MSEINTEILVVGGGLGGVAAALAACRAGRRVVLTEETDWIGGQLTAQAVPPDEHPWIESYGATATYRELRTAIRDHYRIWYPLTGAAARRRDLNPGAGYVSKLCHEPRVALAVLQAMVAPHLASGRLRVLLEHVPAEVFTEGDRVSGVTLWGLPTEESHTVTADYVLDATETGELLPLAKAEYVTGAESREEYGEPSAPAECRPLNMQGITYCFAISHHEGENHVIDRPADYDFWRSYRPDFWPGPLLGFLAPDPRTLKPEARTFDPNPAGDPLAITADQSANAGGDDLWLFRRILAKGLFEPGAIDSDITLVNWPLNDYWLRPIIEVGADEAAAAHREAKQLSLSVLYWLQTEAPRPDGGRGYPGLRLRHDVVGTADGLAKSAYVRESRRIRAVTTVTEHHVSRDILGGDTIHHFPDSVGVGAYRIDLHPSTGGDNYIDVASVPFEIPLGALLPIRMRNLLPAGKNIGTTHISNGCYRLHPVEWNVGEVAGHLAAYCLRRGVEPRAVREDPALFSEFAAELDAAGVERRWPAPAGY